MHGGLVGHAADVKLHGGLTCPIPHRLIRVGRIQRVLHQTVALDEPIQQAIALRGTRNLLCWDHLSGFLAHMTGHRTVHPADMSYKSL